MFGRCRNLFLFSVLALVVAVPAAQADEVIVSGSGGLSSLPLDMHGEPFGVPAGDHRIGDTYDIAIENGEFGRYFVSSYRANQIWQVSRSVKDILKYVELPEGSGTRGIALSGSRLFAANSASNTVSVININALYALTELNPNNQQAVLANVPVGKGPMSIAVEPASGDAYVTTNASDEVYRVFWDEATNSYQSELFRRPSANQSGPYGIAVVNVQNQARAYVTNANSDTVSVLDLATGAAVVPPIRLNDDLANTAYPVSATATPDQSRVYLTNFRSSSIQAVDTATNQLLGNPIAVGPAPMDIAFSDSDGPLYGYVANSGNTTVSVLNVANGAGVVSDTREVSLRPIGIAFSDDGIPEPPNGGDVQPGNNSERPVLRRVREGSLNPDPEPQLEPQSPADNAITHVSEPTTVSPPSSGGAASPGVPAGCRPGRYLGGLSLNRGARMAGTVSAKGVAATVWSSHAAKIVVRGHFTARAAKNLGMNRLDRSDSRKQRVFFSKTYTVAADQRRTVKLKASGKLARLIKRALKRRPKVRSTKLTVTATVVPAADASAEMKIRGTVLARTKGKPKTSKFSRTLYKNGTCRKRFGLEVKGPTTIRLNQLTTKKLKSGKGLVVKVRASASAVASKVGIAVKGRYGRALKLWTTSSSSRYRDLTTKPVVRLPANLWVSIKLKGIKSKQLVKLFNSLAKRKTHKYLKLKYRAVAKSTTDGRVANATANTRVRIKY